MRLGQTSNVLIGDPVMTSALAEVHEVSMPAPSPVMLELADAESHGLYGDSGVYDRVIAQCFDVAHQWLTARGLEADINDIGCADDDVWGVRFSVVVGRNPSVGDADVAWSWSDRWRHWADVFTSLYSGTASAAYRQPGHRAALAAAIASGKVSMIAAHIPVTDDLIGGR